MAHSNSGSRLLFWLMFLIGGGALSACLLLPPWLELRELRQAHAAARQRIARLEDRLTRAAKQIEHARDDPAYVERLARREFGIETPGVEMIWIETSEDTATQPASASAAASADRRAEMALRVEQAARTSPLVSVFVLDQTRPIVMGMSAIMVLVALVLLFRGGTSKRR